MSALAPPLSAKVAGLRMPAPVKPWVLPILLALVWEAYSHRGGAYGFAFVPWELVGHTAIQVLASGDLTANLQASVVRVAFGLGVGGSLGVLVGAIMGFSPTVNRILAPLYHAIRQVPIVGWLPLMGLWFGVGPTPKLIVVSLAAFYPLVLNTYEGLHNADPKLIEAGRVMTLTPLQLLLRVRGPSALPMIATGLTQALSFAWLSTVGVEVLMNSGAGLGSMMAAGQEAGRPEIVMVGILSIGVVGFAMTRVFAFGVRRLVGPRGARPCRPVCSLSKDKTL